jgi:hypothetical protein
LVLRRLQKWLKQKFGTEFKGGMSQLGEIAIPFRPGRTRQKILFSRRLPTPH